MGASALAPSGLDVRPLTLTVGAEIAGVDLAQSLDDTTVAAIRAALLQWRVVFFRNQTLTPAEQVRFAGRFGDVVPGHPTLGGLDEHPEVLPLESGPTVAPSGIESRWHTDVTFTPEPPLGSVLYSLEVPPVGGDTQWANMVLAYQKLSAPLRDLLDGLHAVHRNRLRVTRPGEGVDDGLRERFLARPLAARHPVVRVHPETGERSLFVNPQFTSHIVELTATESEAVLAMLYAHLQRQDLTVRFRWEPGCVAFWDNRATAHHAPVDLVGLDGDPGFDTTRRMHRVTIAGDRPRGIDGVESIELDGSHFL